MIYSETINKFYTGITSNIEKRIHYHNSGRSLYTRSKGPWYLVYSEEFQTRQQAIAREKEIKAWKSSKRIIDELSINLKNPGSSGSVVTG
ncbi:MAG: GIY-YIG nuclease family protein [Pseudomonadota bacterium]|nr:GIY-YIG nuclease family protein [Pseudomonadota bacterium]